MSEKALKGLHASIDLVVKDRAGLNWGRSKGKDHSHCVLHWIWYQKMWHMQWLPFAIHTNSEYTPWIHTYDIALYILYHIIILCYIMLYCIVLYYIVVYCIAFYCIVSYFVILYYIVYDIMWYNNGSLLGVLRNCIGPDWTVMVRGMFVPLVDCSQDPARKDYALKAVAVWGHPNRMVAVSCPCSCEYCAVFSRKWVDAHLQITHLLLV